MKVVETASELSSLCKEHEKKGESIGFVPTMGALHAGHISLVRKAKAECDLAVCSIFVNPTQFNNALDLDRYPRDMEPDKAMLQKAGCDILFHPGVDEMYPEGLNTLGVPSEDGIRIFDKELQGVVFGKMGDVMEGKQRRGHFKGVAVVVNRLFNMAQPTKAYFGEKDFQQLAIIKEMVRQTGSQIEIIGCPTLREKNGLAMSSRNQRLTKEERDKASVLFTTLKWMKENRKAFSLETLKRKGEAMIRAVRGVDLEYLEVSNPKSLEPISGEGGKGQFVVCVAANVAGVRLIDNIIM